MLIDKEIKALGTERIYEKNQLIFEAESPANSFYYILSGEIRVYKMDLNGNELEVGRFGPEDFIG